MTFQTARLEWSPHRQHVMNAFAANAKKGGWGYIAKPGGWFGNCVPAAGRCNNETNCEDSSDERSCSIGAQVPCIWPMIHQGDGLCSECHHLDIPRCAKGQAGPSESQKSCICFKCQDGWSGPLCDKQDGKAGAESAHDAADTTPSPTTTNTMIRGSTGTTSTTVITMSATGSVASLASAASSAVMVTLAVAATAALTVEW